VTKQLDQETHTRKKPILWYWILHTSLELLVFILLVALTTAFLRPLQDIMQTRMRELRDSLIRQGEAALGRNIRYDAWGPSLLGSLDIRNLQITDEDGQVLLQADRVHLSYSLITLLLQGVPQSIRSIQLDAPYIALDLERDADILGLFSGESPGSVSILELLNPRFRLSIRNGSCGITAHTDQYTLKEIGLEAAVEQGMLRFQGHGNARALTSSLLPEPISAQMECRVSGASTLDFKEGSANLEFGSLSGSFGPQEQVFRSRPVAFTMALSEHLLSLKKRADHAPFDLSADYDFRSGKLTAVLDCEDFAPGAFLALEGPWKDYARWLGVSASGSAALAFPTLQEGGGLQYDLSLKGRIPEGLLPLGGGSFRIQGSGTETEVALKTLSVQFPQGTLAYQGNLGFAPFTPQGRVSLRELSFSGKDPISGDIQVSTQDRNLDFEGKDLAIGSIPFASVEGSVRLEPQGLTFSASLAPVGSKEMETGELESEIAPLLSSGGIALEGFWDYSPQYGEIHLVLDAFSAADLLTLARPFQNLPDLAGVQDIRLEGPKQTDHPLDRIRLDVEAFITTDLQRFSYHAPRVQVRYGQRGTVFSGVIVGTHEYVECRDAQIRFTEDPIVLSASADLRSLDGVSFSLKASYQDRPYALEGTLLDRNSLSIRGSYGLKAAISRTDFGGYSGYIEAKDIPVPYQGRFARLSLMSGLRYDGPDFWNFDLDYLELADLSTPATPRVALYLSGRADQVGATFPQVLVDDGLGALRGALSLGWEGGFSDISAALRLRTESGGEWYDLTGRFKDKHLTFQVEGEHMQVIRFVRNPYNLVMSGGLKASWDSLSSFSGELTLDALSAVIANTPLEMSGKGRISGEALSLSGVDLRYGELNLTMPSFFLSLPEQRAQGDAQLRLLAPGRDLDMAFSLGIGFDPLDSWFDIPEVAKAFRGVLHVDRVRFNDFEDQGAFDLAVSRTDSVLALSGGPKDMIRLRLSDQGDFYASLSSPSPVRGTLVGTIGPKTLDIEAPDIYVDLAVLGELLPAEVGEVITLTGGFATASIRAVGSLGDPEFFGTAQGYSVRLKVPSYVTADIRPVPVTVTLQGNEMSFGPIPAAVGSGQGTVAGWFQFTRWIPNTFTLTIEVPPESPIPFDYDSLGIMVQGNTWGKLYLSMQDFVFSIQGDLSAQDTNITLDTEKLSGGSDKPDLSTSFLTSIVTDITLRTGRKVEFLWPTKEFPIVQAYADQGASLRITSDSAAGHFTLVGDVPLRSGDIFYFERNFYLREGLLSFNENEEQFEPTISARAEVRDQTDDGPVTISMIVDNAPLRSFTARFESSPALSQAEIFAMLGQAMTGVPAEGSEPGQTAFLSSGVDILAQTQLSRFMQRRVRDFLSLDMFSFRTQLPQNLISWAIQQSEDTSAQLGNSLDNTAVYLGKYIGSDVFLQMTGSLRYNEHLRDVEMVSPENVTIRGFTIEPDLGMELQGPLFNIRVNVAPRHLETMFVNDVSCTLTWSLSSFKELLH
jgi:hypothetical protein